MWPLISWHCTVVVFTFISEFHFVRTLDLPQQTSVKTDVRFGGLDQHQVTPPIYLSAFHSPHFVGRNIGIFYINQCHKLNFQKMCNTHCVSTKFILLVKSSLTPSISWSFASPQFSLPFFSVYRNLPQRLLRSHHWWKPWAWNSFHVTVPTPPAAHNWEEAIFWRCTAPGAPQQDCLGHWWL